MKPKARKRFLGFLFTYVCVRAVKGCDLQNRGFIPSQVRILPGVHNILIMNKIVGNNIKEFRSKMDLTLESIAGYLNISVGQLTSYEAGSLTVPINELEKLSDLFGVELADLLEENKTVGLLNLKGFQDDDLKSVGEFKKIIKNYIKMKELNNKIK